MPPMSYSVQLITPEEKGKLYEAYEPRLLYTNKAEIYGRCIKILNDPEAAKNKWKQLFHRKLKNRYFNAKNIKVNELAITSTRHTI
jgi:hypothetical protein